MRTWLKLIGSAESPITKPPYYGEWKKNHIGIPGKTQPGMRNGDHLFLYAPGGSKSIFALAEATGDPEHSKDYNPDEKGSCPWTLPVKYLRNVTVDSGIHIDEISSSSARKCKLSKSIGRHSHIKLYPEEYESAYSKFMPSYIPLCVDLPSPLDSPDRVPTTISRILRDSVLVATLKRKYDFSCQLCGTRLELPNGFFYCEAHHIRPLGAPHNGCDEEANLVIVCPNHHVLLDYGAIPISKDSFVSSSHYINQAHIDYHNRSIHKSPSP
jgi:hypothetical protein